MANNQQNIKIDIGTSYNGQGMAKAMSAINSASNAAKKSAGAVGQLAGAFEGMGGQAAKSIGAVASGLGALATGGVFGAVIYGVTMLVSWLSKLEEQQSPIKKIKSALEGVATSTEKITSASNVALSKIDKTTKAVDALTAAQLRLANAEAKAKKNALDEQVEGLASDGTEETEARNIMTRAGAEKAKVQIDADSAKKAADAIVDGITRRISAQGEKIGTLRKALYGYDQEGVHIGGLGDQKSELEKQVVEAKRLVNVRKERKAGDGEMKEAEDQLKESVKALNDFIDKTYNPTVRQLNDAQKELEIQEENLQAAEQERANVVSDNTKKIKAAEDKYAAATWEAAHIKERNQRAEEQLLADQLAMAANLEALDTRQGELLNAQKELENAEWQYAQRLKEARAATAGWRDGGGWGDGNASIGKGQIIGNGINGRDRYGARNNQSINDAGYNARVQAGYDRNAQSQGYGLSAKEQREYNNLANKMVNGGRDALTGTERKRWDELKAKNPEDIAKAKEAAAEKAKDKVEAIKTEVSRLATGVQQIQTQLDKLGLKQ